ncbi:MAG: methionine--tRNA ligase [bacterium]
MDKVTYEEFKKMDIRVGRVVSVESIEGADKLLKFQIDFGDKDTEGNGVFRQIVSGLKEFYPDYDKLVGKQLLYILNLEPRTIKGVESQGMLLAVDGKEGNPVFLVPEVEVEPGSKVR